MRTTPITPQILQSSVIAVPPLSRTQDLSLNKDANRLLIAHLESAGVRSLMYGGNANFFNVSVSEYAATLDFLEESVAPDTWLLPSVGPDFGKMMDQARILKGRRFPAAMLLPSSGPHTHDGIAAAVRRFTDAAGIPAVLYVKADRYLPVDLLAALHQEGRLASIKYAVVRSDPATDPYLTELVARIGTDILVSGIGERPAIVHFEQFGIRAMTSGSVCIAPHGSMRLLHLMHQGRYAEAEQVRQRYLAFEDCRDHIHPIRVLHDGISLAEIAPMGPLLPLLSNLAAADRDAVSTAARALLRADRLEHAAPKP
jgi:hypothetical protein